MMECQICGNELETEGEEIEGICEDCQEEYSPTSIFFGPSPKEEAER